MLGNELSWQATCSGNLHICTQQHWTSTRHCDEQSGRLASVTVFQTSLHPRHLCKHTTCSCQCPSQLVLFVMEGQCSSVQSA